MLLRVQTAGPLLHMPTNKTAHSFISLLLNVSFPLCVCFFRFGFFSVFVYVRDNWKKSMEDRDDNKIESLAVVKNRIFEWNDQSYLTRMNWLK